MCGIFGVIAPEAIADHGAFLGLAQHNAERGNLGYGGVLISHETTQVFRQTGAFDPRQVPTDDAAIRLGHVRAPTAGQDDQIAAIHPFETRDLLLAHNGLLLNHTQFAAWNPTPAIHVDSLVIIGGIQHKRDQGQSLIDAIRETVEALDGQQACWLWDKPARALYLWRVMAPIYSGLNVAGDQVCFSSIKAESMPDLLKEGVIHRLDGVRFAQVGAFRFYNPYL